MKDFLENAIQNHVAIEVIFKGDSNTGIKIKIVPIIIEHNFLLAFDPVANQIKQYPLDRIKFENNKSIIEDDELNSFKYKINSVHELESLYNNYKSIFINQGWLPLFDDNSLSIALFSFCENGDLKKSPDIAFFYNEYLLFNNFNLVDNENNILNDKQIKPFRITSVFNSTTDYQYLYEAIGYFFSLALKHAPNILLYSSLP